MIIDFICSVICTIYTCIASTGIPADSSNGVISIDCKGSNYERQCHSHVDKQRPDQPEALRGDQDVASQK